MHRTLSTTSGALAWLFLALANTCGDETPQAQGPAPYARDMNKKFTDPHADMREFVKRFESEARDVFAKRHDITRAVHLQPGQVVADIGAGTGLFTELFAEQVGATGTVYAVDIGPAFLQYINQRAKQHAHDRIIKTVQNSHDSAALPPNSVDVAFICDTYHHFEHPDRMLDSIHRALRPGGRLVIVDFDLLPDSGEFVKQRARAAKEVYFREISTAGFERVDTPAAPTIKENFYAEFRRTEHATSIPPVATQPAPEVVEERVN